MICVGIDVAKDKHDCVILNSEGKVLAGVFTIPNNADGFDTLLQKIHGCTSPDDKIKVGLEATGHYSYNILGFLLNQGLPTYVINPLHTNLFRKSMSLRKTKTDRVDAKTIAAMLMSKLYKTTKAELDTQIKTLEEDAGADPDVLKKLRNQKKVWKLIIGMTVLVRMRKTFLQPINPILTRCQRFRLNYMNCIPSKKCCDMTFTKQKLLQTQNGLQANAGLGFQKYLLPQKEVKTTHTMRCGHISKRLMKALSPNTSITTSSFRA